MNAVAHAKQRAQQRYGVRLNRDRYWGLVMAIRQGRSIVVAKVSNSRSIHIVDGMVCVYSSTRHRIITFLPADCWETKKWSADE